MDYLTTKRIDGIIYMLLLKEVKMITNQNEEKASISIRKIIGFCILFLFLSGICVFATNTGVNSVKIILSNNYEIDAITSKTKVSEILEEKHIILLPDEKVTPAWEETIGNQKEIKITKISEQEEVVEIAQSNTEITIEQVLKAYAPITEKMVTEQVAIPFETITKDVSNGSKETANRVLQQGQEGLREVTYRVKYQNEKEIEKIEISSTVIKEPVNKIIQVKANTTSRAGGERTASTNPATTSSSSLASKVAGKTPSIITMNTSAYCSCSRCCGKSNGITGSGQKAQAWYTIAAGKGYPIGTIIYIPYFKNKPNGGWFVVQDRGGAISNSKIDVFMGSHNEALSFGRKNLECYVYR